MAWSILLASLAVLPGSGPVPEAFPDVDMAKLAYSVAVVEVEQAGGLPAFPGCESRNVWCLHSPSWFRGKVRHVLAGPPVADPFHASTSGHYGPVEETADADEPKLMLLAAHGPDLLMIRYAEAVLYSDSAGKLHLPVTGETPDWWLPCEVRALAQPVTDRRLAMAMARPIEPHQRRREEDRLYFVEGRAYWPRQTIPIDRIERHLRGNTGVRPDFACLSEGETSPEYGFLSMVLFAEEGEDEEASPDAGADED